MKRYISVQKAINMVIARDDDAVMLRMPYKVKVINSSGKEKRKKNIPLKFLMNAIRLINLKHPETEDRPAPIEISSIDSCYIFGSAVNPQYKKVKRSYFFGLYKHEKEERIIPNDIDIMCFVNNGHDMRHIKSMTSWKITMNDSYGGHTVKEYGTFDVSHVPSSIVYHQYEFNKDFLNHIKESGVCIMGKNIIGARRYADWHHDTIKNTIACYIPREENVTDSIIEEQLKEETKLNRSEILDL